SFSCFLFLASCLLPLASCRAAANILSQRLRSVVSSHAPMAVAAPRRQTHPPGLYVLFFTELWERYSFYSMMAILALYMNEALHFDVAHVGQVYGLYQAGVYLMPVAGGLIADRWLGFPRSIIVGGALMMMGHVVLGVEALPFFYSGLVLLACGSGLLKPNVSTLVGNLYRD